MAHICQMLVKGIQSLKTAPIGDIACAAGTIGGLCDTHLLYDGPLGISILWLRQLTGFKLISIEASVMPAQISMTWSKAVVEL